LWAVFSLVLISCPLNLPEQVRIKASPSLYMPVGDPLGAELGALTSGLGKLTNLSINPAGSGAALIYDYQGPEYGDARVVMVVMKDLANQSFVTVADGLDVLIDAEMASPVPILSFPYTIPIPPIPQGANDGIDLSALLGSGGVLKDYPGLEFRSVPAYLYVNGPARIFRNGNVHIDLQFKDASNVPQGSPYSGAVEPLALPGLPADPGPVVQTLPKPGAVIELAGIFNAAAAPAGLKAELGFTVGPVVVNNLDELKEISAQLRSTPLTADLVLLLPFQFRTASPIPVFAGPDVGNPAPPGSPPNPAMGLINDGGDLLGRDSGGGSLDELMEGLRSISLEIVMVNNLGINGYVLMCREMPTTAAPNPAELGRINLSGKSVLTIARADLEQVPFSPALEIYLDGEFDIKRSLPPEGAMAMNLAIVLRSTIDMTL
jgi:hypothetical protein